MRGYGLVPVSTGGTTELPVSLADLKDACRLDSTGTADDAFLSARCFTAAAILERESNRSFLRKQFDLTLDGAPCERYIKVPVSPLVSVQSIVGIDVDGAETTLSTSAYTVDVSREPGRILLNSGYSWPSGLRSYASMRVRLTAGYSTSESGIDDPLRTAIGQFVAHFYEHRGDGDIPVPQAVRDCMAEYLLPEAS